MYKKDYTATFSSVVKSSLSKKPAICSNQISLVRKQNEQLLLDLFVKHLKKHIDPNEIVSMFSKINIEEDDKSIYLKFNRLLKFKSSRCESRRDELFKSCGATQRAELFKSHKVTPSGAELFKSSYQPSYPSSYQPNRKPIDFNWKKKGRVESREASRKTDIFRFYTGNPRKYLDLGGGDGKITSMLGSHLQLKKENIICADINEWFDKNREEKENITYVKISCENPRLPFSDGEFSLVSCFQSLHHMKNIEFILSELHRIVEPGGYVIIREHDCDSEITSMIIDIEHCIFECVLDDPSPDFSKKYYGEYRSKFQWTDLFHKHGFLYCNKHYNFNVARNNPTRYYYSMYYRC